MWRYVVQPVRPQMKIWRLRFAYWIPKATNTHSENVILVALPLQQWLNERAPVSRYTYISCLVIQDVPLATEPVISLIILTPMKILQRNLNSITFVVWEMKRNVSVVFACSRCNILISGRIIKETLGSVASGTHCIIPTFSLRSSKAFLSSRTRLHYVLEGYNLQAVRIYFRTVSLCTVVSVQ